MPEAVYYSTGQAANELGVTQARIRSLCQNAAIKVEVTDGGQFRIPKSELDRIKREGLPKIPRPFPDSDNRSESQTRSRRNGVLLSDPSQDVIGSAEQVVRMENELKSLGLLRQKEEATDWFRARDDREAERRVEREQAEREREAHAESTRRRELWEAKWIEYALATIPSDATQSVSLEVNDAVEQILGSISEARPDVVVRQLVEGAVDRALAPWRKSQQIALAIQDAFESAPRAMQQLATWNTELREAAAAAVARVNNSASAADMRAAARSGIAPVVRRFEHLKLCVSVADTARLPGASTEEREEAGGSPQGSRTNSCWFVSARDRACAGCSRGALSI